MRDLILVGIFVAAIPFMLKRPAFGVLMWVWLSVMNPHRLSYGFAYSLPFAAVTAGIVFISLFLTKDERRLDMTPPVVALALFTGWMCLTSLFPLHEGSGFEMWSRVMKIMLMNFVALAVIRDKQQIHWLLWVIVCSLAFYGAKGGLFVLATGGNYLVWGPEGSFISGNNEVALAFVMCIPLMRYLQLGLAKRWHKISMTAAMLLTALAAIGSHSRGALLAIAAMATVMWWKSRNKFAMGFALVIVGVALIAFMPASWTERMNTIKTYDADSSAMGRINAWWMAFNLAKARPLGGGYEIWDPDVFAKFAPDPLDYHAAHSIYFQIMGEHGFIGLILFMSIGACTWFAASDAKRRATGIEDLNWVGPLVDMLKVSMIGYAVGGAFLSLAYFDVPYYVMVLVVATRGLAVRRQKVSPGDTNARRNRFGAVSMVEAVAEVAPRSIPLRANDWRGHGASSKLMSSEMER